MILLPIILQLAHVFLVEFIMQMAKTMKHSPTFDSHFIVCN